MRRNPAKKKTPARAARKASAPRRTDDEVPAYRHRILVIEDDAVDRMSVCRALQTSKLNPLIDEAADIAAGLEAIRKKPYDAVILDHILPDGKSSDLLQKLRDLGIRLPIVITTGYGDEMLVVGLLKAGAADYLPKDKINADTLFRAISHAIRVYKAEEELRKQDILLQGVAQAATLLHSHANRLTVMNQALAIVGTTLDVDRVVVFEQGLHTPTREPTLSHRCEWLRGSDSCLLNDPRFQNIPYRTLGLERWSQAFNAGAPMSGLVATLPEAERRNFEPRGVRSILLLPVLVEGRVWGFVQVEDLRAERTWSETEKSILSTMATALGNALIHRRADEALRQSEERYRVLVEDQPDIVCRFLPDGTILFANEACCQFLGKSREELAGLNILRLLPESDRASLRQHFSRPTPDQPVSTVEHRLTCPDGGRTCWLQWRSRGLFDGAGRLVEVQSVGKDITDRRETEDHLRDSESKLRALIEQIPAITYTAAPDSASTTLFVSPQVERILGYTPADYEADPDLWRKLIHPEDRDRVLAELGSAHEARKDFSCEYRMTARDGHTVWMRDTGTHVRDPRTGDILLQGVMYDITEQRKAELALADAEHDYQAFVENLNIGVFRTTPDGRVLRANTAHARMMGFDTPEEFLQTRAISRYRNPDDRRRLVDELEERGYVRGFEIEFQRRDGSPLTVAITARIHRDAGGRAAWYDGVIEDITERREAESMLRMMRFAIERSADAVVWANPEGRFVYVNDAACRLAGYSRDELLKRAVSDFDVKATPEMEARFWDILRREGHGHQETVVRSRDGRMIPVEVSANHLTFGGQELNCSFVRDISGRKRADEALRASREYLGMIINSIADPIFVKDRQHRFALVNEALCGFVGRRREELLGRDDTVFFPKEQVDVFWKHDDAVIETGEPNINEEAITDARGTVRTIITKKTRYAAPDGERFIVGVIRDITERKRSEEALRASEERYRTLAETSPDMIYMADPEGRLLYVNSLGASQFGMRPEDIVGKSQDELFPPEIAALHKAAIRRVAETGQPHTDEAPELLAHRKTWIDSRIVPIKAPDGRVVAILGFSRDITQRRAMEEALRESEENFKAVAENMLDGVAVADEAGRIIYTNRRCVEMTGYSAEELRQRRIADFIAPEMAETVTARAQARLRSQMVVNRYEAVGVRKDGRRVPIEISGARTVWRGQDSSMAIIRDISEQKRLMEERERLASSLLEIQEKERTEISAMLHDHLGQLLTLAKMELGSVSVADARSKTAMQSTLQRLDEALASVRRLAVSLRPPALDDLGVEAALEMLTDEFSGRSGVRIAFRQEGTLPPLDRAAETCLYRVLQETLTNIARHSGAGRVDVVLHAEDDHVCLEVRDDGRGFDAGGADSRSGIGFIGMRERLARCGGSLEVVSAAGKGTTILACVPRREKSAKGGAP